MKSVIALFSVLLLTSLGAEEITQNPHGKLNWECFDCHNTSSWTTLKEPMAFSHDKTGFALVGQHAKVACGSCHKDPKFSMIGVSCADCHTDIHRAQFGNDCEKCHTPRNWSNNRDIINMHSSRGFSLVGIHAVADCGACHKGQQLSEYAGTPVECKGCHANNFAAATDPNHVQLGVSSDCQNCHSPVSSSWNGALFTAHPAAFPLHGGHAKRGCTICHEQGYSNTNPDCYNCHTAAFNATTNPAHVTFGFPTTCAPCHNDASWTDAQFDHVQASNFALEGAHATILCTACHVNNQLTGLASDCFGCHQQNFIGATSPDHVQGNFPQTCLTCHNQNAWSPATFDHTTSQFPLTGAHASLLCIACHANGYQNTPFDCYSCHLANFNGATNPDHVQNNFDHNCTVCHSNTAWSPATFNHNNTNFPLTEAHSLTQCVSCHSSGYQNTPTDCFSCHEANFNGATNPNHIQNNFGHNCAVCHNMTGWSPATFNHNNTTFPLTGAHISLQCISCHANGYQNTPSDCYSCHANDYNGAENHVSNGFSHNCLQCHNTNGWGDNVFNHANTTFPLTGAHTSLQCIACHAGGYQNTPSDCYACHQINYNDVTDPSHVQNNFDHNCLVCHTTSAWQPATFDHSITSFPLTGAHTTVQCQACHANGYQNTPTDCYSCHQSDFNGVVDPNHEQNNFSHDCTQCHNNNAWQPATFNHAGTRFPLTGAHISLQCISCHATGYQNTPFDCYSCHQANYAGVTDPNHIQNNFDHDCTICHSTSAWQPATFDHSNTTFPLTGAHTTVQCVSCHANGYQNTPTECFACHQTNFNGATNPNHIQNNFDHDCLICHNTSAWQPSTFNHNTSGFPLTGAHIPLQCIACHANGYINTPADCYSCHANDFNNTNDPNHVANGFSHDCTQCHNTSSWDDNVFNHANTTFPLTGAHTALQCIACHANGYQNTPTDCYACHQGNFDGVTDPNHVQNNFDHNCTICHSTTAWQPATFNHVNTTFPLTGAHIALQCIACHANGYQNTPTDCFACHQTNFNGATNPNHIQNNFDHDCLICHNTSAWQPSTFNHNTSGFPLTGAHIPLQCIACHANGYINTPADCYSCHANDFNNTNDPNHVANGFSHDCTQCHNTSSWDDNVFNHANTTFPLTGAHTALQCIACHANGYQNTPTDCYACHQGNFDGVTDPNHVQNNFDHNCTICHSTTAWQPATFNHNTTSFPLTGAHIPLQCIACHANGFQNTPTDCYACHQANYDGATDPKPHAEQFRS